MVCLKRKSEELLYDLRLIRTCPRPLLHGSFRAAFFHNPTIFPERLRGYRRHLAKYLRNFFALKALPGGQAYCMLRCAARNNPCNRKFGCFDTRTNFISGGSICHATGKIGSVNPSRKAAGHAAPQPYYGEVRVMVKENRPIRVEISKSIQLANEK